MVIKLWCDVYSSSLCTNKEHLSLSMNERDEKKLSYTVRCNYFIQFVGSQGGYVWLLYSKPNLPLDPLHVMYWLQY